MTNPNPSPSSSRPHVIHWSPETIDNEFMGKKKSKCCCIYEKPRNFDDPSSSSSSSDDSEGDDPRPKKCTEHCRGHTRHCYTKKIAKQQHNDGAGSSSTVDPTNDNSGSNPENLPNNGPPGDYSYP
ncbi:unnamed protein product [Schistocephalus solidus]|uniref:E3 ubiquitin-protein ligase PPP1R11 n=1 Tax=Schistocephalus solidus TaxID=70667 RepID=A0A3P7D0N9_SCHSO|nr:unnamed protein product [Schistocephalus solidus]